VAVSADGTRALIRSEVWTRYGNGGQGSEGLQLLELWNLDAGRRVTILRAPDRGRAFGSLAFSGDGSRLAVAGFNGGPPGLHIWDAATGRLMESIPAMSIDPGGPMAFTPDGRFVCA